MDTQQKKVPGNRQAIKHGTSSIDIEIDTPKSMEPIEGYPHQVKKYKYEGKTLYILALLLSALFGENPANLV